MDLYNTWKEIEGRLTGMDMSYKYEVVLRQETPMIHFQYDQQGACLRGSELKPKLDKFLIKKKGQVPKEWYQEKKEKRAHESLDYKVRLIAKGPVEKSDAIGKKLAGDRDRTGGINQMYFGNMVGTNATPEEIYETYKETVFYQGGIRLEIICLVPELMEFIQANIGEFFAVTNFGTRQSKGFGGFSILSGDEALSIFSKGNYKFFYIKFPASYEIKMNIADAVYCTMKGGKNYSKFRGNEAYIKGYIQRQYLHEIGARGTGSDKAFMKSQGFFRDVKEERLDESYERYEHFAFVRALLGLADHYEFRDDQRRGTITIKSDKVERYKSPITIKFIGSYIFFIFEDTLEQIKGQTFKFSGVRKDEGIRVPDTFDVDQFIDGFMAYFDKVKNRFTKIGKPYEAAATVTLKKGGQ